MRRGPDVRIGRRSRRRPRRRLRMEGVLNAMPKRAARYPMDEWRSATEDGWQDAVHASPPVQLDFPFLPVRDFGDA